MLLYKRILKIFPQNITYAFAYGSGVKQQLGYDEKSSVNYSKMIDFIFCVDNPEEWHKKNLEYNPNHYSGIRRFGTKFITNLQNRGAKVYFNTLVPIKEEGVVIKYGIISTSNLITDLEDWKHLYIAGRLHKPCEIILPTENIQLKTALSHNLEYSLRTALLLLPTKFTKYDLFYTIADLSYRGDFRMIFGETKSKVGNIVKPQLDEFYELYLNKFKELSQFIAITTDKNFEQEKSSISIEKHLSALPKTLRTNIIWYSGIKKMTPDIYHKIALRNYQEIIWKSINQIVWRNSILQSIKNIPTAGITKSLVYSWKKALKTFKK